MNSPQVGYQSAYMHQHQVPSRHVGSYSLGITSPMVRHTQFEYPPVSVGGVHPIVSSRYSEGSYVSAGHHPNQIQNPHILQSQGRQGFSGSPSTGPPSGSGYSQQINQQRQVNNTQGGDHELAGQPPLKSQTQIQSSQPQTIQQSQSHQQLPQNKANHQEFNEAQNFENASQRGNQQGYGSNGPAPFQKFQSDPQENFFYEQEFAATKQLNGQRIGRGIAQPIYSYDEIDGDQRVRKPMDEEQEKKLQKLKNEKTKRELHIQELDYRIHILEQENHSLRNQMDQMRNDYKRLNQVYEEKYSHEIDRLRLENQDYENSNKQWANRFKDIEQKCDDLVSEKQDLDEENRRLGEKILKIQVLLHEQPIKNQVRQENQSNKYG